MKVREKLSATFSVIFTVTSLYFIFIDTLKAQSGINSNQSEIVQLEHRSLQNTQNRNFPFRIKGSQFYQDDNPVFLNIICYQPLEPGQEITDECRENRIKDDLRRLQVYQKTSDPVLLRVYPQPTIQYPNRLNKIFYDGIRDLGIWIIRDIYFGNLNLDTGKQKVDAVIAEVNDANALDLIFAWEIGDEFKVGVHGNAETIEYFVTQMCNYIKEKINALNIVGISDWTTWASWPPNDPLLTDGIPVIPQYLDYISYNIYSYDPERIRDHQAGPTTGTPYQGYLVALKKCYPEKPLVIMETGLPDSNMAVGLDQAQLHPWYPAYRRGNLIQEQVAEGLADRYWDARLLKDENDPNMVIAGLAIFEWNDEWHKVGNPMVQDDDPEEHFGLGSFKKILNENEYQLRYKLQQETIRDLYTLRFDNDVNLIEGFNVSDDSYNIPYKTEIRAVVSESATHPIRLRWETSRGYIIGNSYYVEDPNLIGEPNKVTFYTDNVLLGPTTVTAVAIDGHGNVDTESIIIETTSLEESYMEILTLGTQKASGRIFNVNLDQYKMVCYVQTDQMYIQPNTNMKSIWIDRNGYWWTQINNSYNGKLICWIVPKYYNAPIKLGYNSSPPIGTILTAEMSEINDNDNDLLPDNWEQKYFGNINLYDRYDDPDADMGNNIEEFLRNMDPNYVNDEDLDGLFDNWEYHYFGNLIFCDALDDPDSDGRTNQQEQNPNLGTHPCRTSQDKDQDGLPDIWEIRWFGNCDANTHDDPDNDFFDNLEEYELGSDPTIYINDH